MNVTLDLAAEIEKRDLGVAELAKAAGLSRTAVARIASGESPGRPRTRRALRAALAAFPLLNVIPPTPVDAEVMPAPDADAIRAANAARLAELQAMKAPWQ